MMPDHEFDALWLDEPPTEDPSEVLNMPEIKRRVSRELPEEEIGLRALLEHPEDISGSWWQEQRARRQSRRRARETSRRAA